MPHAHQPNYVTNAKWDCIEKVQSRIITIIELYRHIFGIHSIPNDKQYWSMCGAHFNPTNKLKGELGHLIDSGLITRHQYYGVDREQSVISGNMKRFPGIKWIHGDFAKSMELSIINGEFNPTIINYDGVMQPKFGMKYLKSIMMMLDSNVMNELILVTNFILTNPYCTSEKLKYSISDTVDQLKQIYLFPDHWDIFPQAYTYTSPSRGANANMGILIFVKSEHDINNIKWTQNRVVGG